MSGLLESVIDIIKEYIDKGSRIVYLHGRLKEAGYTGSRKELSEWLVAKGLWTKRGITEKAKEPENDSSKASESGKVSILSSVDSFETTPSRTENESAPTSQNADPTASDKNRENAEIPDTHKLNFTPPPHKTKTVYSGTLNLNQGKN